MLKEAPQATNPSREVQLATELWGLEQARKKLESEADELKTKYKTKEAELQELLIEEGKSSTGHIQGVGEFAIKRQSYLSVTKEKLPAYMYYLKQRGEGGLIKEVIEANTLKKHLENKMEELSVGIEVSTDDGGDEVVRNVLGHLADDLFPIYKRRIDQMSEERGELSSDEKAAEALKLLGAGVYQEVKMSHVKKGK